MNNQYGRLSNLEAAILSQLSQSSSGKYGLEIVNDSKGKVKKGSVYVILERMTEKRLVVVNYESEVHPHAKGRRPIYKATQTGKRVLEAYKQMVQLMKEA